MDPLVDPRNDPGSTPGHADPQDDGAKLREVRVSDVT
jgi:hypothetical protein